MKPQEFVYWLQGWFEIAKPEEIKKEQLDRIKEKLDSIFTHEADKIDEGFKPSIFEPNNNLIVKC